MSDVNSSSLDLSPFYAAGDVSFPPFFLISLAKLYSILVKDFKNESTIRPMSPWQELMQL